jgi:AcrR family transcriptional regulator
MENGAKRDRRLTRKPKRQDRTLGRADWIAAALDTLVEEGVDSVKVFRLANSLGVTRGSFYWHFKSRDELLATLLEAWEAKNTRAIVSRAEIPHRDLTSAVLDIFALWVDRALFDPGLDFAIREWARRSAEVHAAVRRADDRRVKAIAGIYGRAGMSAIDAFIRARILYFMQIGYYALDLGETMEARMRYLAPYLRGFNGEEPDLRQVANFRRRYMKRAAAERSRVT